MRAAACLAYSNACRHGNTCVMCDKRAFTFAYSRRTGNSLLKTVSGPGCFEKSGVIPLLTICPGPGWVFGGFL